MKYLVLNMFSSYGKTFHKGSVIDEREIRSPRLRQSEGKIVPAVPSLHVPVESGTEEPTPQDVLEVKDKPVIRLSLPV